MENKEALKEKLVQLIEETEYTDDCVKFVTIGIPLPK